MSRPYSDPMKPGRLDADGVEWWACDPYPTWYRWDAGELTVRRGDGVSLYGRAGTPPTPWASVEAELHQRERARNDEHLVTEAHRFVVIHFGGDHIRAAWFFDELAKEVQR